MIVRKRELKTVYGSNSQNRARYAICIIIVFALSGFTLDSHAAYPQTMTIASPFVNLPGPNDTPRRRKAFALWDKRENTGEAVAALSIVEEITIVRDGKEVCVAKGSGTQTAETEWLDKDWKPGRHYYYALVELKSGNLGFSSPVFVGY